ncbi:hypothetical protein EVB97_088 [Rhizobium phage RHph_Y65]|uniref:Uncharacterized protein n=1 Tax=Rhizobium phage RHph_Y65 TaxID=2509785 RepID=A0A7S5RBW1_9CAUD|nr:hypothetical protein PQC17_gp088 [Rhizobium phage RHph_Y65]QIG72646.1 hypothetical protein EVB97_088 [Rhizobium phage RHph_Y65]
MKNLILVSLVLLAGCEVHIGGYPEGSKTETKASVDRTVVPFPYDTKIYYFKDPRTSVCFAVSGYQDNRMLTTVPCSDDVLKAIDDDEIRAR